MKLQDRYVGIGLLVISAILLVNTFTFRTTQWELLSMAFWPRILIFLIVVISIYLIIKGDLDPENGAEPLHRNAFLTAAAGYVYVIFLELLGFLIVTPVFVFIFSLVISKRPYPRRIYESTATAVLGTIIIFTVFELGLKLMLPSGFWE